MADHAFVRHARARRGAVAVAASAAFLAGGPLLPSASAAPGAPQETVVPATLRSSYTTASLTTPDSASGSDGAGAQGVFHRLEGRPGIVWTRYADGTSVDAPPTTGTLLTTGTGSDFLAYRYDDGRVALWNAVDGTTRTLRLPDGHSFLGVYGTTVVTFHNRTAEDGTTKRVMDLLEVAADETFTDTEVTGLPEGMQLGPTRGADGTGIVFQARMDDTARVVEVDRATGRVRGWTQALPSGFALAKLSAGHLAVYRGAAYPEVLVVPRSDLSATPAKVTLDAGGAANPTDDLAVLGDWLIHRPSVNASGTAVKAVPIAGGAPVTLLASAGQGVSVASDGSAVAIGRTGTDDWGIQRIRPGADGAPPVVTLAKPLPKPPFRIQGLSLDQGRLVVEDYGSTYGTKGERISRIRTVAATGTPGFGDASRFLDSDSYIGNCDDADLACAAIQGTAAGQIARLDHFDADRDRITVDGQGQYDYMYLDVPSGGRITDVSGRYLIHTTATKQNVYRTDSTTPVVSRTPGPAALSGDVLWAPGTTTGSVTAYSLTAKKTTETLTTDAGCTPTELQALGRWLYWTCGDSAGVYDRTAKKSVPVPAGEAELGDGYVVTHDKGAGKLTLTTVASGTPASRVIGDLPDTGVSQRDVRWTVDESGANVAYVDGQERVHLVPSDVAQQPLRLLEPARSASSVEAHERDARPDDLTTVVLSKPAASWRLTVRDKVTGKVVDGRDGGAVRGELAVGWHGTRADGIAFLPNGRYDWTLSVIPADGVGAALDVRGTVQLLRGGAVRHDYASGLGLPDGTGDLLTLNSSGALSFHYGAAFKDKVTGTGWATSITAVPFGDLGGDRCNDLLVRQSNGSLRLYKPACGEAATPSTASTTVGTSGWNQYDVLTSPGDVSGDGRPDLVARNASTGDIYLYKGTSTGGLSARAKIFADWRTYKKIVGVGDITGDGIGDLIAQDKANNLYRYDGTGTGTFKARTKVFTNWGGSYNAVAGAGDTTGDGKADLVSRDTSGNLYRHNGDGKGSFGAPTKIASGWQGYKGVF
ncbi:FG-GAP repeat domain-containing protein [Streptomyces sp. NPDC002888]|uniref:FG-GAP repeat domain-containing protein n=1 Tax=Streptomyces sp. NPDC002888 TaxID=3364668 RepID=UPI0036A8D6F7